MQCAGEILSFSYWGKKDRKSHFTEAARATAGYHGVAQGYPATPVVKSQPRAPTLVGFLPIKAAVGGNAEEIETG